MANTRVSDLIQISVAELVNDDLLLLSDVAAQESKKLALRDLSTYLSNTLLTGSFNGTASWAENARSASYTSISTASYSLSSSWASNSVTSSYALSVLSSSYSTSGSYALTASYTLMPAVQTVFSASFAGNAQTASYLLFRPNNGTASYALTASCLAVTQNSTSYSSTASYALYSGTASLALNSATANTASYVLTSSHLVFDGTNPNGTASYAIFAASVPNVRLDFGTFLAITQSIYVATLDAVSIAPTFGGQQITNFEVCGTIDTPFTTSNSSNGRVEMFVLDRNTGYSQSLDFSPIYINIGSNTSISGTMRYPFTLRGEAPLNGLYKVYVTASYGEVYFDTTRTMKYKIASLSDQLTVSSAEQMIFNTYPTNGTMLWSSSLHPGVGYQGSASQVTFSGSNDVTELLVPPNTLTNMYYTWTLGNLTKLTTTGNTSLINFGGVPTGIISMSVSRCNLNNLPDLSPTSLFYLDCSNNNIVGTLSLPSSLNYINCSNNSNLLLPLSMPSGLQTLVGNSLFITGSPSYFPDTLQSMSLASCINLSSWNSPTLPLSLSYLDCNLSQLTQIPAIPLPCVYLDISNCQMTPSAISSIGAGLVTNGQFNGYFNMFNNPASASAASIVTNIATLVSRGWTVIS